MTFDGPAVIKLFDRVASHAASLGLFDNQVATHEPKNPPGNGVWCALWTDGIAPIPRISGLNETGGRVTFRVRIGANFIQEPQDSIDPHIMVACTTLMEEYSSHFTLDQTVMAVDLLGAYGQPLTARGSFVTMQQRVYRVLEIILPVIIDNMWVQSQ